MNNRSILDFKKHLNKEVCVQFQGGREVKGILRGYDDLVNIVLDDTTEYMRDLQGSNGSNSPRKTRSLGMVVCRGTAVSVVYPVDGSAEISNPYEEAADE